MGKTTARPHQAASKPLDLKPAGTDPIPVALEFLRACRDERRPLALVTGTPGTGKSMLMHRFQREINDGPIAYLKTPTQDPHDFLENLLSEFGFDAFEAEIADLIRLIIVYMLHESRKGRRPVVIIEDVQNLGPAVWDTIRELAIPGPEDKPSGLFVLTGGPAFDSKIIAPAFDSVYSLDVTVAATVTPDEPVSEMLEVQFRDHSPDLYHLEQPKTAIGRNGTNDIQISGAFVSRFHAVFVKEQDGIHVIDLRSTNGTFVNGQRVQRHRLHSGDIIKIEEFRILFTDPAQEPSSTLNIQAPLDHLLEQPA